MLLIIILSIIAVASNETSRNQTTHYNVSQDLLLQDETIEELNNTIVSIDTSDGENSTYEDINQTQEANLTETNQTTVNETEGLNITDADSTEEPLNITIITEEITNATITVTEEINITEENITEEVINEITLNNISNETILNDDPINTAVASNETRNNQSEVDITNETVVNIKFAEVIGGESTDTPYIKYYTNLHKNFSNVEFKDITHKKSSTLMKVGSYETKVISGYIANNYKYAIDLVVCNHEKKTCNFRINGVSVKDMSPIAKNIFRIDDKISLKINSIKLDYCDHRRFCDMHFEAYDLVNVTVEVKE